MTADGLALARLALKAPGPSLAVHANRAINCLHAVGRHPLSVVQSLSAPKFSSQCSQFNKDTVEPSVPVRKFNFKAYVAIT